MCSWEEQGASGEGESVLCTSGTDIPPLDSSLHFLPPQGVLSTPRRWNRSRPRARRAGQSPRDVLCGNPLGNTHVCGSCPRPGVCSPALCFLMSPLWDILTSRADSEGTGHLSTCRSGEEGVGTREQSHLWMRGSPTRLGSRGGGWGGRRVLRPGRRGHSDRIQPSDRALSPAPAPSSIRDCVHGPHGRGFSPVPSRTPCPWSLSRAPNPSSLGEKQ